MLPFGFESAFVLASTSIPSKGSSSTFQRSLSLRTALIFAFREHLREGTFGKSKADYSL